MKLPLKQRISVGFPPITTGHCLSCTGQPCANQYSSWVRSSGQRSCFTPAASMAASDYELTGRGHFQTTIFNNFKCPFQGFHSSCNSPRHSAAQLMLCVGAPSFCCLSTHCVIAGCPLGPGLEAAANNSLFPPIVFHFILRAIDFYPLIPTIMSLPSQGELVISLLHP